MQNVRLQEPMIIEYVGFDAYTIIYREGGIQNFTLGLSDLPEKYSAIIRHCSDIGAVQETILTGMPGFLSVNGETRRTLKVRIHCEALQPFSRGDK